MDQSTAALLGACFVQLLQTIQTIALRREVKRATQYPPPPDPRTQLVLAGVATALEELRLSMPPRIPRDRIPTPMGRTKPPREPPK
jgi:hypothetical protein